MSIEIGNRRFTTLHLNNILENKKDSLNIINKSFSDDIYYVNLDNSHLLLIFKTPENDNILSNYDSIEYYEDNIFEDLSYVRDTIDDDLLYWYNFEYGKEYGMGKVNKGVEVNHSGRVTSVHYAIYWEHPIFSIELFDSSFTCVFWCSSKDTTTFTLGVYDDTTGYGIRFISTSNNCEVVATSPLGTDTFAVSSNVIAYTKYIMVLQYDGVSGQIYYYMKSDDNILNDYENFTVSNREDLNSVFFYPATSGVYATKVDNSYIYDIKVYNKILTTQQIDDLFKQGYNHPVYYWFNFQNNNTKNLGYLDNGKEVRQQHLVRNNYYQGHSFHMYYPISLPNYDFSICFWIKRKNIDARVRLGIADISGVWDREFRLFVDSSVSRIFLNGHYITLDDTIPITWELNKRYFVSIQYDGKNGRVRFFRKTEDKTIDEHIEVDINASVHNPLYFNGKDFRFLAYCPEYPDEETVIIYDIKIYNYNLTAQKFSTLFDQGILIKKKELRFKKDDGTNHSLVEAYADNGDYTTLEEASCLLYEKQYIINDKIDAKLEDKILLGDNSGYIGVDDLLNYDSISQKKIVLFNRVQTKDYPNSSIITTNDLDDQIYNSGIEGSIMNKYVSYYQNDYKESTPFKFRLKYPGFYELKLIRDVDIAQDIVPTNNVKLVLGINNNNNIVSVDGNNSVIYPYWTNTKSSDSSCIFYCNKKVIDEDYYLRLMYTHAIPKPQHWFNFRGSNKKNIGYTDPGAEIYTDWYVGSGDFYYPKYYTSYTGTTILDNPPVFFPDNVISICFWVYIKRTDTSSFCMGVREPNESDQWKKEFTLDIVHNRIRIKNTDTTDTDFPLNGSFETNKDCLLVFQYDGANGKVNFYRKTTDKATDDYQEFDTDPALHNDIIFDSAGFCLYLIHNKGGGDYRVNVHDIKLYNHILTHEQVNYLFHSGYELKLNTCLWTQLTYFPNMKRDEEPDLEWQLLTTDSNYSQVHLGDYYSFFLYAIRKNDSKFIYCNNSAVTPLVFTETSRHEPMLSVGGDGPRHICVFTDGRIFTYNTGWFDNTYGMSFIWALRAGSSMSSSWAIDSGNIAYRWTDSWESVPGQLFTQISSGRGVHICGVGTDEYAYQLNSSNNSWIKIPDLKIINTSVGDDGVIYAVTPLYELFKYQNNRWKFVRENVKQVSYNPPGICILNLDNNIEFAFLNTIPQFSSTLASYFKSGVWTKLPSSKLFSDINISQDGKYLIGVCTDTLCYYWDSIHNEWVEFITPVRFTEISIADRNIICGVDSSKNLYEWNGWNFAQLSETATSASVNSNREIWRVGEDVNVANIYYKSYQDNNPWTQCLTGKAKYISISDISYWVIATTDNNVYRTTDNGINWVSYTNSGLIQHICGLDNKFYYVNTSNEIYVWPDFIQKGTNASKVTASETDNILLKIDSDTGEIWGIIG